MPTCQRHKDIPEGVEVTDEQWLDHFQYCVTRNQRLEMIRQLRGSSSLAQRCLMEDHRGKIESQAAYTRKLLAGIREEIDDLLHAEGEQVLSIRDKLKGLIS